MPRPDRPDQHADADGRDHRDHRQLEGGGEQVRDQRGDRARVGDRRSEVALGDTAEIPPVLHDDRVVEPCSLPPHLQLLLRHAVAERRRDRVTRRDAQEDEQHRQQQEQEDRCDGQPRQDVAAQAPGTGVRGQQQAFVSYGARILRRGLPADLRLAGKRFRGNARQAPSLVLALHGRLAYGAGASPRGRPMSTLPVLLNSQSPGKVDRK